MILTAVVPVSTIKLDPSVDVGVFTAVVMRIHHPIMVHCQLCCHQLQLHFYIGQFCPFASLSNPKNVGLKT